MKPFISIYIPAYKNVSYLSRLLQSIQIQTYTDFELIITDDSPDESVTLLVDNFSKENSALQIRYFKNNPAKGMPSNWNYGLSMCQGEWIKIMHDDDWFSSENSLQSFVHKTSEGTSKFIFSHYNNHFEKNDTPTLVAASGVRLKYLHQEPLSLLSDNVIGPPSVTLIHNSIKEQYDSRLKWRVDIDYYVRVLQQAHGFDIITQPLINVGISTMQVTQSVKYNNSVEIPEAAILLEKYGINSLKNGLVYDSWWRFFRNLNIRSVNDLNTYSEYKWPEKILKILSFQSKIPQKLLQIGVLSKFFMSISFLTNK